MVDLIREHKISISPTILDTPNYLDVSYAPDTLKNVAVTMIENINPLNNMEKTFLRDCKNALSRNNFDKNKTKKMIEVTLIKDKYKKQNFSDTEISKYYD